MNFTFFQEIISFIPEIFFSISLCFFLLFCSLFSTNHTSYFKKTFIFQKVCFWVSIQLLFLTLILTLNSQANFSILFYGSLTYDFISFFGKAFILLFTIAILIVSKEYLKNNNFFNFEFFIIFLISTLAIILIVDSCDLISFYLALELQALSFYILSTFKKESAFSTEAGLKYFIIGAFSSGFFLFGCSLIYGFSGTTNYFILKDLFFLQNDINNFLYLYLGFSFIIISFLFKLGAAPFHIWILDVYEGSPTNISLFFACVPKLTLLLCLCRFVFTCFFSFFSFWQTFFLFSSLICFFVGSFGALAQRKIKRFLVYSSIGHIGFILLGLSTNSIIGLQSVFFYVVLYIVIAMSSWIAILSFSFSKKTNLKFIDELEGLWSENIGIAFFLMALFFSIAGIPPFGGFFIKFFIFFSAIDSILFIISIIIVIFSVISCFYYLRLIKSICYTSLYNKNPFKTLYFYSDITKAQAIIISSNFFIFTFFCISPELLFIISHKVALHFIF